MTTLKYEATMSGHQWFNGPTADFSTIAEARRWSESYGTTADSCRIVNLKQTGHPIVAIHVRDTSGNGRRWYRGGVS